jgi:uncharacterized protein (DUF1697 family)
MALVVLLKGINVGGHRTMRPSMLAARLQRFDAINVGTAGTFVVRARVTRSQLRTAIQRLLPFDAEIMICAGRDILDLVSRNPFAGQPSGSAIVQFVSVLSRRSRPLPLLPFELPATGRWGLRVLEQQDRFIIGIYRREMRAITLLGQLEQLAGSPAATRSWSTIQRLASLCRTRSKVSAREQ